MFGLRTGSVEKDGIIRKRMGGRAEKERRKGDLGHMEGPSRRDRHTKLMRVKSNQIKVEGFELGREDLRGERSRKLWRSQIRDSTFQEWKNDKSKALNGMGMRTSTVNIELWLSLWWRSLQSIFDRRGENTRPTFGLTRTSYNTQPILPSLPGWRGEDVVV